ncbi:two-component system sensor histidine kinase CreC, partial [bacterium]
MRTVLTEIKPAVRQSTEETLVDTANLLAELIAPSMRDGTLQQGDLARLLSAFDRREPHARIWGLDKARVNHRIYVTDASGRVLLDSTGRAVGEDYSRWNDVHLTLRGQYGARSTQEVPDDEYSTVMYVAAPVRDDDRIIGVVTVAKPNRSSQPYIDAAQRHLLLLGAGLVATGLAIGALLSGWISLSIRRLTSYAQGVARGERVPVPQLPGDELSGLAGALDRMRAQLEGKAYVERYVQTLTHELKGPLSGIRGAAEVLRRELAPPERERFLGHIDTETARLQHMSERLLDDREVELRTLVDEVLSSYAPRAEGAHVVLVNEVPKSASVNGERFLLRQALANLVDNALEFTPPGGRIVAAARGVGESSTPTLAITVSNEGEPIPEFALPRLTERFYSLPRPSTGRKSTGLGLNFVQEVAELHGGSLAVGNVTGGVVAELRLPAT